MQRSWMYRIRPSVQHMTNLEPTDPGLIRTGPDIQGAPTATQLRWDPFPSISADATWLTGLATVATNGNSELQTGGAVHHFVASKSMVDTVFVNTVDAPSLALIVPVLNRALRERSTELKKKVRRARDFERGVRRGDFLVVTW